MGGLCRTIGVCLATVSIGFAQQDLAFIEGRVFDAASSEPIHRADVLLYELSGSGRIQATRTDSKGRYRFPAVPSGVYKIAAEKNGWVLREYSAPGRPGRAVPLEVRSERPFAGIDVRLERAATLVGRVRDEAGEPVSGAHVVLHRLRYGPSGKGLTPAGGAQTDDRGEYRLHNIQPGEYLLAADYEDRLLTDSGVEYQGAERRNYARTFYPGVYDFDGAAMLRLEAGTATAADFDLRRVSSVTIAGIARVQGDGVLEAGVQVQMFPDRDRLGPMRRRAAEIERTSGRFEIGSVPAGAYILFADAEVDGRRYYAYRRVATADRSVDDFELALRPGATVAGRVRLEGDGPEGFSLESAGLRANLWSGWHNRSNTTGEVQADGEFEIPNVAPMVYSIAVRNLPEEAYLRTIRVDGREAPDGKIDVTGNTLNGIELVVQLDGGRLEGVVTDEDLAPVASATVLAAGEGLPSHLPVVRRAETDESGRYGFRGLAAGRYRVMAFDWLEAADEWRPGLLEQVRSHGERVEIADGSSMSRDLQAGVWQAR